MAGIPITAGDPVPDVKCLHCGKIHEYDQVMGWGCFILMDEYQIPNVILGAWCRQECFENWFSTQTGKQ